jgi:polyhydroxyalkanoate synthesis regulator phasin
MVTREAHIVDADGATITDEPRPGLTIAGGAVGLAVDVARMGVRLGVGLAALALAGARRIALEAVDRGAELEKRGLAAISEFEREQVTYMKDYVRRARGSARPDGGASIETHVEEALRTHDVPTRDDIRELHEQISRLDEKVSKLTS